MTGPQDRAAAGRDRLRAGHADREQVIQTLKDAFVQGRVTGTNSTRERARRCPRGPVPTWPRSPPTSRPRPGRAGRPPRPPVAAGQGGRRVGQLPDHRGRRRVARRPRRSGPPRPHSLSFLCPPVPSHSLFRRIGGTGLLGPRGGHLVGTESSRRQLPPRPGPGGHALGRPDSAAAPAMTGFPPSPAATRPAPTCGFTSHAQAARPARAGRAPRGVRRRQARCDAGNAWHRYRFLPGCPDWALRLSPHRISA